MPAARFGEEGAAAPPPSEAMAISARARDVWEQAIAASAAGDASDADRLFTEALELFTAALELEPDNIDFLRSRGILNETLGHFEPALEDYQVVAEVSPSADAFRNIGDVHRLRQESAEALAAYDAALELDPSYVPALVRRGLVHGGLRSYERAEADFSRAIELDPDDTDARRFRGITYFFAKRHAEAAHDLERVVAAEEARDGAADATVLCRLGDAYYELHDYERADSRYGRAIELDPRLGTAFAGRGWTRLARADPDGALADATAALDVEPLLYEARQLRGRLLKDRRQYADAIADYEVVAEHWPSADSLCDLADARYAADDMDGAQADYTAARERYPESARPWVGLANVTWLRGDVNAALSLFTRAIEVEPDRAWLLVKRAEAKLAADDVPGATADLDAALELERENVQALVARGRLHLDAGEWQNAIDRFDQAISADPTNAATLRLRGYTHEQLGQYESALADYEQVVTIAPTALALLDRAAVLRALGRLDDALSDCSRAIELEPDNPWCRTGRAELRILRGEYEPAIDDLDTAVALAPEHWQALRLRAVSYESTGRLAEAIDDYGRVTEIAPSRESYCDLADAKMALGDAEAAKADFARAIEIDRTYVRAHIGVARATGEGGDLEGAVEHLGRAIEADPSSDDARHLRARVLDALGRSNEALEDYLRIAERTDSPDAWCDVGDVLVALNEIDDGLRTYNLVLERDPGFRRALVGRGYVLAVRGAYGEALEDLDAAIETEEHDVPVRRLRGIVLENLGRWGDALSDFEWIVDVEPSASAFSNRGDARRALGDVEGAIADYTSAVETDPESVVAYVERARLLAGREAWLDARADYDAAISLDEKNAGAYAGRGEALAALSEIDEAVWDFDRAIELDPDNLAALRGRASATLQIAERFRARHLHGKMVDTQLAALRDIERAIELAPNDVSAQIDHITALNELEGYDWVVDNARGAQLSTDDGDTLFWLSILEAIALRLWGVEVHDDAHHRAALDLLETVRVNALESAAAETRMPVVSAAIGLTLLESGQPTQAIVHLDAAAAAGDADQWVSVGRCRARFSIGDHAGMSAVCAELLEQHPNDALTIYAQVGQALALRALGDERAATHHFEASLGPEPTAEKYVDRSLVMYEFREFELFERDLRKALALDEECARAANGLAWLYLDLVPTPDRYPEALDLAKLAMEWSDPVGELFNATDTYGWALYRLGRFDEAIGPLREAEAHNPYRLLHRVHVAAAKTALGR